MRQDFTKAIQRWKREGFEGGAYTVKVGFVDQLSGKYIKSSKLLGEPKYTVSINGETQELTGKDGASQSIDVEVDGDRWN